MTLQGKQDFRDVMKGPETSPDYPGGSFEVEEEAEERFRGSCDHRRRDRVMQ